jgi:transposase InsO family protein
MNNQQVVIETLGLSAQLAELTALLNVFQSVNDAFSMFTDSLYVAQSIPLMETCCTFNFNTPSGSLFSQLQNIILAWKHPFYISHIRAHSGFPGPLAAGNDCIDRALIGEALISDPVALDRCDHDKFHLSSHTLRLRHKITKEQARMIVKQCSKYITLSPVPLLGVNPRGLMPNHIWQMDVTHYAEFGKLKYIHVCIDTCSGFLFASLHMWESSRNVIDHCLQAFNPMWLPKLIKTDNWPSYTGNNFTSFCKKFGIKHKTGIPYNPMRQGVVERAHRTLKVWLLKTKQGQLYPQGHQKHILVLSCSFFLNFLQTDFKGQSAAGCHWHPITSSSYAMVKWRDPLTNMWNGLDPILIWERGSVYVFSQKEDGAWWLPERLVRQVDTDPESSSKYDSNLLGG